MILDTLDLPPRQREIEADLCIVGSGPAALVVCREILSTGTRVAVLESGGLDCENTSQNLNAGKVVGAAYTDLRNARRRQVGGTVNIWNAELDGQVAAKYVPLDAFDFECRDWVPHSGWPFGADELEPWYRKAQAICGLGPFAYDACDWARAGSPPPLPLDERLVTSKIYQFGTAAQLIEAPIAMLRASKQAQLFQHASVTELVADRSADRVSAALVAVPGRRERIRVKADTFVLAAGAIENARLLLLSDAPRREGLGNEHDLVGRFFMEHPRDYALTLLPARATFLQDAGFYDRHTAAGGTVIMGRLAIAADALREARSLQASATLIPAAHAPSMLARSVRRVLRDLKRHDDGYPRGAAGWSRGTPGKGAPAGIQLLLNLEQAPMRDNRIVLGGEHDEFGRRRAELHWTWTDAEQQGLERTRRRFADALESAGYGVVKIQTRSRPDPNAHHHAGTTRMHADPRLGVVNPDLRVHGIENLYITGASVFPTAGFANPTLTVVALAARLGDLLRRRFVGGPSSAPSRENSKSASSGDH